MLAGGCWFAIALWARAGARVVPPVGWGGVLPLPLTPARPMRASSTSARGDLVVSGLQLGNVWIGVQPALGVEGDPMR